MNEGKIISKKRAEKFAVYRIWRIFASLLKKRRAFSSAGSEHLPYKQRVGGSNPSTPTKKSFAFAKLFFYLFFSVYTLYIILYYMITEECSSRRWQSHHFPRKSSHPCRTKPQTGRAQCLERASRFRCGTIHRPVCSAHLS